MKRIGILTSGGDAPGMNAAVRAAVRAATNRGMTMVGYIDGFSGYVAGEFVELDVRAVGNQIQKGGTFIGTSRCPEFFDPQVRAAAAAQMRHHNVEGLIVVGGDGSFRGALDLAAEHHVPVVGLPGTIDNDVYGTDETIGFDTAVNTALEAIDRIRDTSQATGTMFFVEVMGRTSGAIAYHTALAGGAAGVLVPEEHGDLTRMIQQLRVSISRGKRSHIIVVAEGEEAGGAFKVGETVGKALDHPYRVAVLGHIQRGGNPTARDRVIATVSGARAVEAMVEGRSGIMVGFQGGMPVEVSLHDVVTKSHPKPRLDLLHLAQDLSG
jgi:6-phosphofructokinase 1